MHFLPKTRKMCYIEITKMGKIRGEGAKLEGNIISYGWDGWNGLLMDKSMSADFTDFTEMKEKSIYILRIYIV